MGVNAAVSLEVNPLETEAEESREIRTLHEFAGSRVKYQAEDIGVPEAKYVYSFLKRSMDIFCALLALVMLLIPMILIAAIIALDSPGSPIFSQVRLERTRSLSRCISSDLCAWMRKQTVHSGPIAMIRG